MAFFDFHIWDLLFYNRYVEKPVSLFQPFWPWVVGGLSYLLCMFFYLVHGLDVYDDESKDHRLFFVLTALEPVYVWLMYVLY